MSIIPIQSELRITYSSGFEQQSIFRNWISLQDVLSQCLLAAFQIEAHITEESSKYNLERFKYVLGQLLLQDIYGLEKPRLLEDSSEVNMRLSIPIKLKSEDNEISQMNPSVANLLITLTGESNFLKRIYAELSPPE